MSDYNACEVIFAVATASDYNRYKAAHAVATTAMIVRITPHRLWLLDGSRNKAMKAAAAASGYNRYKATHAVATVSDYTPI